METYTEELLYITIIIMAACIAATIFMAVQLGRIGRHASRLFVELQRSRKIREWQELKIRSLSRKEKDPVFLFKDPKSKK